MKCKNQTKESQCHISRGMCMAVNKVKLRLRPWEDVCCLAVLQRHSHLTHRYVILVLANQTVSVCKGVKHSSMHLVSPPCRNERTPIQTNVLTGAVKLVVCEHAFVYIAADVLVNAFAVLFVAQE